MLGGVSCCVYRRTGTSGDGTESSHASSADGRTAYKYARATYEHTRTSDKYARATYEHTRTSDKYAGASYKHARASDCDTRAHCYS